MKCPTSLTNSRMCELGTKGCTIVHSKSDLVKKIKALKTQLDSVNQKYKELLYEVEQKYPGKTRHQTALKMLKGLNAPAPNLDPDEDVSPPKFDDVNEGFSGKDACDV